MADYELFQIEISKTYTNADWRDDLRRVLRRAGDDGVPSVFLFADHQVKVSTKSRFTNIEVSITFSTQ